MNNKSISVIAGIVFAGSISTTVNAHELSSQCKAQINDEIAYNLDGRNNWNAFSKWPLGTYKNDQLTENCKGQDLIQYNAYMQTQFFNALKPSIEGEVKRGIGALEDNLNELKDLMKPAQPPQKQKPTI